MARFNEITLVEKIIIVSLFVNFIGIFGFWTFFLFYPSEPITLELSTHILAEYTTAILVLLSFILFIKRSRIFKRFVYFPLGLLFYASINAMGWATSNEIYPFLVLMVINVVVIGGYVLISISKNGK